MFLGLIPIALFKIKTHNKSGYFPIEPFLWLVLFASFYEFFITTLLQVPPDIWFKVYIALEFFAFEYYFYRLLNKRYKPFFYLFSILFVGVCVVALLLLKNPLSLTTDSYLSTVEILMFYFFTVQWFRNCFVTAEIDILEMPDFYFIVGIIFYLSGAYFLFLMGDIITEDKLLSLDEFWILNIICNIFLRSLLIIGVWKIQRK